MPTIRLIDHHTVYDNPVPNLRSRHAYFPDLVALPSGELLALFMLAEAMEATDGTTMVSRSADGGRTWELQGPLHERPASGAGAYHSDYLKATLLADGRLIAAGYNFHRSGRDEPVTNAATDGVRGGDNLVSFSDDDGRTWSPPAVIPRTPPRADRAVRAGHPGRRRRHPGRGLDVPALGREQPVRLRGRVATQ